MSFQVVLNTFERTIIVLSKLLSVVIKAAELQTLIFYRRACSGKFGVVGRETTLRTSAQSKNTAVKTPPTETYLGHCQAINIFYRKFHSYNAGP